MTLELVHVGGAKKTVEVLGPDVGRVPRLLFHWGSPPATYCLDVVRNRVQRAHEWRAANQQEARNLWNELVRARRLKASTPCRP